MRTEMWVRYYNHAVEHLRMPHNEACEWADAQIKGEF